MPLIILLFLLPFTSLAQANMSWPEWNENVVSSTTSSSTRTRIACLGDSITAGGNGGTSWPTLLQDKLGTTYYLVHNYGLSGDTAGLMVDRWRTTILPYRYRKLVILAGTNDLTAGTNAATLSGYITTIADEALAAGMQVVIVTILPRKGHAGVLRPDWSSDLQTRLVVTNSLLRSYCTTHSLQCVDAYPLFGDPTGMGAEWMLPTYSVDGLHPNAAGYDVIATQVKPFVQ